MQECLGDSLGMLTPSQIANLAMDRTMWRKVVLEDDDNNMTVKFMKVAITDRYYKPILSR